jgi:hypothetical protein
VRRIFRTTRALFPNAKVVGSSWSRFVAELSAADVAALPRFSSEWGDQWLAGALGFGLGRGLGLGLGCPYRYRYRYP